MSQIDNLGAHVDGALIAQSQAQKEVTANALVNLLSNATQGLLAVAVTEAGSPSDADTALTADQFFGHVLFRLTGSPSVPFALIVPAGGAHLFAVDNRTGRDATVIVSGGGSPAGEATVPAGMRRILHASGADVIALAPAA